MHSIQTAARASMKIRSYVVPKYLCLIESGKHDQSPPCCPGSKEKFIKCPDNALCGEGLKKKNKSKITPRKLDTKEELDNPDCPWCRKG